MNKYLFNNTVNNQLKLLPDNFLSLYLDLGPKGLQNTFDALEDAAISTDTFSFNTSVSSVYSIKMEDIELGSFIKHKRFGIAFFAYVANNIRSKTV